MGLPEHQKLRQGVVRVSLRQVSDKLRQVR